MKSKSVVSSHGVKFGVAGMLVTMGIVYGDIGTSPLYVFRAILNGLDVIKNEYIYGAVSLIIWTLTLLTTIKYVIITLRADNKGEGGIFSLFALIRRKARWAYIFAIIGGCTLLADGIITPSITVVSAIEGLRMINPEIYVVPIAIAILIGLFSIQRFGTSFLGKAFGPIMLIWFSMLGFFGFINIIGHPDIIKAFNPYYGFKFLAEYPDGFVLLGAVFLCTTGAEALYSDLGHCGIKNIRMSWIFVKSMLILNYLGQGAWIIGHASEITKSTNPFFSLMPQWFVLPGVVIAAFAAVVASQALISGSYTLISEAISLNFWPKVQIKYPTTVKGQLYIPSLNTMLMIACILVVLFFQESNKMDAAYGLSITVTMLMTTVLLSIYLRTKRTNWSLVAIMATVFLTIEISFLLANLTKFFHGGWVTIIIASILLVIMFIWHNGRKLKFQLSEYSDVDSFLPILKEVSEDLTIPKYATNLVYITRSTNIHEIESKIIYSIVNKQPKRADVYWFIHVDIVDEPYSSEYKVTKMVDQKVIRIDFKIGFRVEPRINYFFRQVCQDMVQKNEIDILSRYESLRKNNLQGDFRFVVIDRIQNFDFDFKPYDQFIMDLYDVLKRFGITEIKALGLDTSNIVVEKVPLIMSSNDNICLSRVD
ncbi:MAG: KUP/HAK/KT family potassium transporter [Bacteroidota bacterium]